MSFLCIFMCLVYTLIAFYHSIMSFCADSHLLLCLQHFTFLGSKWSGVLDRAAGCAPWCYCICVTTLPSTSQPFLSLFLWMSCPTEYKHVRCFSRKKIFFLQHYLSRDVCAPESLKILWKDATLILAICPRHGTEFCCVHKMTLFSHC